MYFTLPLCIPCNACEKIISNNRAKPDRSQPQNCHSWLQDANFFKVKKIVFWINWLPQTLLFSNYLINHQSICSKNNSLIFKTSSIRRISFWEVSCRTVTPTLKLKNLSYLQKLNFVNVRHVTTNVEMFNRFKCRFSQQLENFFMRIFSPSTAFLVKDVAYRLLSDFLFGLYKTVHKIWNIR